MVKVNKSLIKYLGISIFLFVSVFEPPILSVHLIYITGFITIILLLSELKDKKLVNFVLKKSGMYRFITFLVVMLLYLMVIIIVNEFIIRPNDLWINRLRCINQLIVLSTIQLTGIIYILLKAEKNKIDIFQLFNLMEWVGCVQGGLAIMAYLFPDIRRFFLKYAGSIYSNQYVILRRGYGYSETLLDLFGYGMGLIAGIVLFDSRKRLKTKLLFLIPILLGIILNARTGILIFVIAVIMYGIQGDKLWKKIVKLLIVSIVIYMLYSILLPLVFSWEKEINNTSISWIISPFEQVHNAIYNNSIVISDFTFIDERGELPSNYFELFFGSGHSIYDTRHSLGFRTDIGYINWIWIYGIVGTFVLLIVFLSLYYRAYKSTMNYGIKNMVIFTGISFYIVMIKGNLLGYSPGSFVNFFIIFSTIYYGEREEKKRMMNYEK